MNRYSKEGRRSPEIKKDYTGPLLSHHNFRVHTKNSGGLRELVYNGGQRGLIRQETGGISVGHSF